MVTSTVKVGIENLGQIGMNLRRQVRSIVASRSPVEFNEDPIEESTKIEEVAMCADADIMASAFLL